MDITRIIAVGIVGGLIALTVREYKPELAIGVVIITGVVIFSFTASSAYSAFSGIKDIMNESGMESGYLGAVMKITGIAYLSEYGAEICRDSGYNSIAVKIEFAGKVCIMLLTIPVIKAFMEVCMQAVRMVW